MRLILMLAVCCTTLGVANAQESGGYERDTVSVIKVFETASKAN